MEEPKLSDSELHAIFENCGWYRGRKENLSDRLPKGYEELPDGVYSFLEEFMGLHLKYEFETEYEFYGEFEKDIVKTDVILCPDMGYDGELDDSGLRYYSKIIGKKLFPVGMEGHAHVALDADLNMYILELGFGCIRISDNPIDGLRKILINSLFKDVYEIVEVEKDKWEWIRRQSSYDEE